MAACTIGEVKKAVKWEANGDKGLRTLWEKDTLQEWSVAESFIMFRHDEEDVLCRGFDVYLRYNSINQKSFSKRFPRKPSNNDDIGKALEYAYQSLTKVINNNHTHKQ